MLEQREFSKMSPLRKAILRIRGGIGNTAKRNIEAAPQAPISIAIGSTVMIPGATTGALSTIGQLEKRTIGKQLKKIKGYDKVIESAEKLGAKVDRTISGELVSRAKEFKKLREARAKGKNFSDKGESKTSKALHNTKEIILHPVEGSKYLAGMAMKHPTETLVGTLGVAGTVAGAVAGTKGLKAKNYKKAALGYGSILVPYEALLAAGALKLSQKNKKVAQKIKEMEDKGDKLSKSAKLNLKKFSARKRDKIRKFAGDTAENIVINAPTAPLSTALMVTPLPGTGIVGATTSKHESKLISPIAKKIPGYKKHVIRRAEKLGKTIGKKIRGKSHD